MHVVLVGFHLDAQRRDGERLLAEWTDHASLSQALLSSGAGRVDVVLAAHRDEIIERAGVSYHFVSEPGPSAWIPARQVHRIAELAPSVIHQHSLSFVRQSLYMGRRLPSVPILAQDHSDKPQRGARRIVQRLALNRVNAVSFTAAAQARPFIESGALSSRQRIFEVVEGSSRFEPGDIEEARAETGLEGDPVVLWVGNLDDNKGVLRGLDAFEQVARARPEARLYCAYKEAPLLSQVRARVGTSEVLRDRVQLLGRRTRPELEQLHRASDFFLLASRSEGSGYSMIEALACGSTPIVTSIPPFQKMSDGGRVGSLTRVGDAEAMAAALLRLADEDRGALRRAARRLFEERLSWPSIGRSLMQAYREISAGADG